MKNTVTLGAGLASLLLCGGAAAYQFEGSGSYTDFDELNDSRLGVRGQYYFNNVDDSGVPRAEAAFLRRASSVGLAFATFDEADVDGYAIGGEAYVQNFFGSAVLSRTEAGPVESDDIKLEAGFLPMDGLRLTLGYEDFDLADLSTISLNGKYVAPLGGDTAINGEVSIAQTDDDDDTMSYSFLADYFVNANLSFGAGYADTDQSGSAEDITLRARMFVIPTLSVQLQYNMQDFNDRIELGVTGRF